MGSQPHHLPSTPRTRELAALPLPHFLCIGSRRSGTTWLYQNLRQHPGIWLPPVKSLRYFSHGESSWPWLLTMWSLPPMRRRWRKVWPQIVRGRQLSWYLRYFCGPRNDNWYRSLFQPTAGQLAGEICHAYGSLPEPAVARVARLIPHARLIYFVRDPIARAWSEASLYFRRRGQTIAVDTADEEVSGIIRQFAADPRRDDLANLRCWRQYFPQAQLMTIFFDELEANPVALLGRVHRFLELPVAGAIPREANSRVASTSPPPPPAAFARLLAQLYLERILALHSHFDNPYTASWYDRARQAL